MRFTVSLEGQTPDQQASVRVALAFDPDNFHVSTQGFGRVLVLPFQIESHVSAYSAQSTRFTGGSAQLLLLSGWLGRSSTAWSAPIPQVARPENQQSLAVPLRDRDIEAIEDFRAGGEVQVQISLNGLARITASQPHYVSSNPQWHAMEDRESSIIPVASGGFPDSVDGTQLRIDREKWLALLQQAGRTRMLVELPFPKVRKIKPWEEAARLLTVAETYHRSGDFEGVPEKCREVFEGLLQILAEQWNVARPTDDTFEKWTKEVVGRLKSVWPEKDAEQADTLALLLNAGRLWSRSSHHFGAGIPKREESSFILHLTTNLFGFCVQLSDAFPDPLVPRT